MRPIYTIIEIHVAPHRIRDWKAACPLVDVGAVAGQKNEFRSISPIGELAKPAALNV